MQRYDQKYFLRGIPSFGISRFITWNGVEKKICDAGYPIIATDITYYIDWIQQTLKNATKIP
jgi:hypothetical protein